MTFLGKWTHDYVLAFSKRELPLHTTRYCISVFSRLVCASNWLNTNCQTSLSPQTLKVLLILLKPHQHQSVEKILHLWLPCLTPTDFNCSKWSYICNVFRTLKLVIDHISACISVKCINLKTKSIFNVITKLNKLHVHTHAYVTSLPDVNTIVNAEEQ